MPKADKTCNHFGGREEAGNPWWLTKYQLAAATSGATRKLKVVATSTRVRMSLGKAKIKNSAPAATPIRLNRSNLCKGVVVISRLATARANALEYPSKQAIQVPSMAENAAAPIAQALQSPMTEVYMRTMPDANAAVP